MLRLAEGAGGVEVLAVQDELRLDGQRPALGAGPHVVKQHAIGFVVVDGEHEHVVQLFVEQRPLQGAHVHQKAAGEQPVQLAQRRAQEILPLVEGLNGPRPQLQHAGHALPQLHDGGVEPHFQPLQLQIAVDGVAQKRIAAVSVGSAGRQRMPVYLLTVLHEQRRKLFGEAVHLGAPIALQDALLPLHHFMVK